MSHFTLAPIVVFAFNRVDHLARTIDSLSRCAEARSSHLTIRCDGPRTVEDEAAVAAVRRYVATVEGFRSTTIIHAESNQGLAKSILTGVAHQLKHSNTVIVLEDDMVVSPHFLRYMNDGLTRYADDHRVASVHGYCLPVAEQMPETFFLQGPDCWGWATWSSAWSLFETDGQTLLTRLRERGLCRHFDFDGQYPYAEMLAAQIAGRNDSWAIRWHASCYLQGLLTLYPGRSLVENIGNDSSGTHCATTDAMSRAPSSTPVVVDDIPVEPSVVARAAVIRFFADQRSWRDKLRGTVKRALGNLA